jgi:hypothetical protein
VVKPKTCGRLRYCGRGRKRWKTEYAENETARVGSHWVNLLYQAAPANKDKVKHEARQALNIAKLKQAELLSRKRWSDEQVLAWLKEKPNLDHTFPGKSHLDEQSRDKLFDEWQSKVSVADERNERVRFAKVDYRKIGMELAALTALCGTAFLLTLGGEGLHRASDYRRTATVRISSHKPFFNFTNP